MTLEDFHEVYKDPNADHQWSLESFHHLLAVNLCENVFSDQIVDMCLTILINKHFLCQISSVIYTGSLDRFLKDSTGQLVVTFINYLKPLSKDNGQILES